MADKYNGSGKRFVVRSSFSKAIAAGVESPFVLRRLGAGQAVSQSGGNLLITTGTTATRDQLPAKVTDKDVQDLILSLFK